MKKQPHAVTAATQALIKLGADYGIEAVHHVYGEAFAELMGQRERDRVRARVVDVQGEMFALTGPGY